MAFYRVLIIVSCLLIAKSSHKPTEPPLNPCNDFYDYVCAKDTRSITNLSFTSMDQELEIKMPDEYNATEIVNNGTTVPLDKLVKLTKVMKWCTEIEVLFTGIFTMDYFGDLFSNKKMVHSARYTAVRTRLREINNTMVNIYYNALHANIEILEQMDIPITQRNEFFHWMFDTVKNNTLLEIENSGLSQKAKTKLRKGIVASKSFFAFYDSNNITAFKEAKLAYETEYYRLQSLLSLEDLMNPIAEKILRLGAIDASIAVLEKHIPFYDIRFLFQAIVANPTNDAFQYLNSNHITVITRNDLRQPEKAMADTLFVTSHEMMHHLYPYGLSVETRSISEEAWSCASREVKMMGNTDRVKPDFGWFQGDIAHEDVVNIIAMRMVMKMAANKSINHKQLKEALETVVGGLCKQSDRKNKPIPHHHPLEISLNTAVRQYPLFSSLYGCRAGERMFAKPEEFCKPLGDNVTVAEYEVKGNVKDVGGFFKDLMNTSKSLNFTYGIL
ncbi:hypothetical protein B9Z55_022941 [Caenorhabditis nigoni]|nr:hypothetical protein B9Z55_022941 [Caenorhabditis nigoni]